MVNFIGPGQNAVQHSAGQRLFKRPQGTVLIGDKFHRRANVPPQILRPEVFQIQVFRIAVHSVELQVFPIPVLVNVRDRHKIHIPEGMHVDLPAPGLDDLIQLAEHPPQRSKTIAAVQLSPMVVPAAPVLRTVAQSREGDGIQINAVDMELVHQFFHAA